MGWDVMEAMNECVLALWNRRYQVYRYRGSYGYVCKLFRIRTELKELNFRQ